MRMIMASGWLLVLVFGWAYHHGPGVEQLASDDAAIALADAEELASNLQWEASLKQYDAALAKLPADRVQDARQIRLAKAQAQMNAKLLPEAHGDLKTLVEELANDPSSDPNTLAEARESLANTQYYMTWLLRLEGYGKEDWGPEIDSSRQIYKLLADNAQAQGQTERAAKHAESLESAIRLARLDLSELQGLPLPKQCQGCKNCKRSGSCKKTGKNPNPNAQKPKDARGASSGPPPDGSGQ